MESTTKLIELFKAIGLQGCLPRGTATSLAFLDGILLLTKLSRINQIAWSNCFSISISTAQTTKRYVWNEIFGSALLLRYRREKHLIERTGARLEKSFFGVLCSGKK